MPTLTEGRCIGPYRIVRLIGEGGMGAVYEARQESLDRRVALKTLHPQLASNQNAVARFFNEAKALSRMEHPSIVQVSDFGTAQDGTAYLVMEYLRGQSLGRRLQAGDGRLPTVVALQLAWQIADVLAVAHAQGVVHRDLKPDNLMLVEDPVAPGGERVKVLDFGIAKLTHSADRNGANTDALAIMGTPMYMSPEQCTGAGGVDAKTDVYSLGCVLYQSLAGRPLFTADGPGQLIGMHLFQEPQRLSAVAPKVPTPVVALVHRLLLKDKNQRPSMSEAADELGRLLSKLSSTGPVFRSRCASMADPAANVTPVQSAQQITTLGQSMGQWSRLGMQRRRVAVAGLWGMGLVAAIVTAWRTHTNTYVTAARPNPPAMATTHRQSVPPGTTAQVAPPASQPRRIHWSVQSLPTGANVVRQNDSKILGQTPWQLEQDAGAGETAVLLRLPGYRDRPVTLDDTASASRSEKLVPIRRPPRGRSSPANKTSSPLLPRNQQVSQPPRKVLSNDTVEFIN